MLQRPVEPDAHGRPSIALDDASLRFVAAEDGRGDGLGGLDLRAADRGHVIAAAREHDLAISEDELEVIVCGVRFRLV